MRIFVFSIKNICLYFIIKANSCPKEGFKTGYRSLGQAKDVKCTFGKHKYFPTVGRCQ